MNPDVERLHSLVGLLQRAKVRVAEADRELKEAKKQYTKLEQEDLPELMRELGVESMKFPDGSALALKDEISCSITQANRPAAHGWLVDRGYGAIIKSNVVVAFDAAHHEQAEALAGELARDYSVGMEDKVHPSTLKSFLKERMAAGEAVPFDLFSIHPYSKAVYKESQA